MIKLTRPDGSPVWVFKAWVQCIVIADKNLFPTANSQVVMSGPNLGVLESVDDIVNLLEG